MSGLSLETCLLNLKSVALTILELLALDPQKFRGSRDPGHAPFRNIFTRSCPDCPWEYAHQIWKSLALTVLELIALNPHFIPVWLTGPLRTQIDTHTHIHTSNEHIISAIHFVHLAKIMTLKCKQYTCKNLSYTYIHMWTYNAGHSQALLESEVRPVARWGRLGDEGEKEQEA